MSSDLLEISMRRIERAPRDRMRPFDRYGELVPDLYWYPLNEPARDGHEIYLIRFDPGASSVPHEHLGREEFMVLQGELVDCDGTVFRAGDFVSYAQGSQHYSTSETGCTLLVSVLGGRNTPARDM